MGFRKMLTWENTDSLSVTGQCTKREGRLTVVFEAQFLAPYAQIHCDRFILVLE